MGCNDGFVNYLTDLGYNVLLLPKADVRPRQIFYRKDDRLRPLGELTTILEPGAAVEPPPLAAGRPAPNISGRRTDEMKGNFGLSLLGTVVGAMGGSALGLRAAYADAAAVVFEFRDVTEDRLEVARLDMYLAAADVSPFSRHVGSLLEADVVYVTTSVLRSREITVKATREDGGALELSVPVVGDAVGGSVEVSGEGESASVVTYSGSVPLAFGFQAVRLYYDRGRYTAFKPDGDVVIESFGPGREEEGGELEYFASRSPMVRM